MDASSLNLQLINRIDDVCMHLFPLGKCVRSEYLIGDIMGNAGESLKIHLSGAKKGFWCDFSVNDSSLKGRSLIKLWRNARGLSWKDARREIMDFLNIRESCKAAKPVKVYEKPRLNLAKENLPNKSPAIKYLTNERKISEYACKRLGIKDTDKGGGIVFERREEGEVVAMKFISIELSDKGKKIIKQERGGKPCLYGKDAVDAYEEHLDEVVVCEGEIDALSWWTMGIPAVSVPGGAGDLQWIEIDWEWLEQFTTIYVSFDMDDAGQKPLPEIVERLGKERCRIVELPQKDFNDCLKGGITKEETQALLEGSAFCDIEEIKSAGDFNSEAWEYFYPSSAGMQGYDTPWHSLPFKIRAHEVTTVTGFEGCGKTTMLNQLTNSLIDQEQKGFMASLEVGAGTNIGNMVQIAMATHKPDKEGYKTTMGVLQENLYMYDFVGRLSTDRLLEAMLYSHKRYGTFFYIIDSLLRVGIKSDDYNGQGSFMDMLCSFVRDVPAHVFLVAHARKEMDGQSKAPETDSIKGSGDIKDLSMNVLSLHRNKKKSSEMAKAEAREDYSMIKDLRQKPCANLAIRKQRNGRPGQKGNLADIDLWFHPESSQFLEGVENNPKKYLTEMM